jgi:hypothetical protein
MKTKERKIRPIMLSDVHWGITIILTAVFLSKFISTKSSVIISTIFFIMSLFLSHNKRIQTSMDYEEN